MKDALDFLKQRPLMMFVMVGLVVGILSWVIGLHIVLAITAIIVVSVVIFVTAIGMVKDLMKGHWGLDILAVVAMISTLAVSEYLAGLIIALMLTGGEALEAMAERRASRELDLLLNRAPTITQRVNPVTTHIDTISVEEVAVGDILIVRSSEVLPVDGVLLSESAYIDESSVTGESLPVSYSGGAALLSGTVNTTESFTMRATKIATESNYASIVQLVEEAVESRSPMVRLADRYAVPFTIVALLIAGLAWYFSGDPVRFAEVLVVATPCPLLIATPVAFMGGLSSAAKLNVIVKDGGVLETLAKVRSAAFDKTGTLTRGEPDVHQILPRSQHEEDVLRYAAAAEQFSMHTYAGPIVAAARAAHLDLPTVRASEEIATQGVKATLDDGAEVRVGKPSFIAEVTGAFEYPHLQEGHGAVFVSMDDQFSGIIVLADPLRAGAATTIERLHQAGVNNIAMVTGDNRSTAHAVAAQVGIDNVHAEVSPQTKVDIIEVMRPKPVLMVGDGINDAPVLAAADVGIAMAGRGATVASESASAVVTSDEISRVADVVHVAKHTIRIALQSIWMGIIISIGLMLVAASGNLPAVAGALLQEVVDLVAIVSALRALRLDRKLGQKGPAVSASLA